MLASRRFGLSRHEDPTALMLHVGKYLSAYNRQTPLDLIL